MTKNDIIPAIIKELKAIRSRPFPDHIVAQAAMVSKEAGNLIQQAAHIKYNLHDTDQCLQAAITTAATSIHFIHQILKANSPCNNNNNSSNGQTPALLPDSQPTPIPLSSVNSFTEN